MRFFFVFLLVFNFSYLKAQNLVINGGFELCDSGKNINIIQLHKNASIKTRGKLNYWLITMNFGVRNHYLKDVVINDYLYYDTIFIDQRYYKPFEAFKGKKCIGLQGLEGNKKMKYDKIFYSKGHAKSYRSYAVLKLSQKLTEGEYKLSIAVKYSGYSRCVSSGLGAVLTYTIPPEMELGQRHNMEHYDADAVFNDNKVIQKGDWQVFNASINADGGEEYIVIGNFFPKSKIKKKTVNRKTNWRGSYYLIDEVKLNSVNEIDKPVITQKDSIAPQKQIKKDSIVFELFYNNSETLLDTSVLLDKMKSISGNKVLTAKLSGYADSKGNFDENIILANLRAENVGRYIQSHWKNVKVVFKKHHVFSIAKGINYRKVKVVVVYEGE